MTSSTDRLYTAAQKEFRNWCTAYGHRFPASHDVVAKYLRRCRNTHGPSSMMVHRAAIARLYRERGYAFDTKSIMELMN